MPATREYYPIRDCPGVGTSSGPVVKEVPFSTGIGGPSAGCKTTPQHNSQTRHPLPNFSQETVESPATAPLLHINICTQENTMRGPVLNISPGLTANGVDMEYRRNAQGTSQIYRPTSQDDGRKSESPSRKRRRISRNSTVSGIEVQETTPPVASAPTIHAPTQPWELAAPPQRRSPGIHVRESALMRHRYQRLSETYAQTCPFLQGVHNPHLPSSHNVHPGLHNNHHNIHNPHHSLHAHPSHAHHPSGSSHHPAQGTSGPVVVEVGQVGVSGLGVAVSGDTLWHPQTAGYRLPCQLHGYYTPAGPHAFAHSCQVAHPHHHSHYSAPPGHHAHPPHTNHPTHPTHPTHPVHPGHSAHPGHPGHPAHPVHTTHPGHSSHALVGSLVGPPTRGFPAPGPVTALHHAHPPPPTVHPTHYTAHHQLTQPREVDLEILSSHRGGNPVPPPLPITQPYNPQTITHVAQPPSFFLSDVRGNQLERIHARSSSVNNVRRPRNRPSWRRQSTLPHSPFPGLLFHFLTMFSNPPLSPYSQADLSAADALESENYETLLSLAERLGEAKARGLSRTEVDQLPSYKFDSDTHEGDQTNCVVCMCDFEVLQSLRVLPCSHEFHVKCIDKWLKSNRTCPICRGDAGEYLNNGSSTSD
ncbi:RING finger protein 44-like isoform X2 [Leptopilina heterotoma]|uniref:RING finger protein 44-like isoform X2 n=1 Tax=Leptopilina heterotoma TaxID=63436 RepID=UPI001CA87AC9|nr:RING finger protein 44-like isoform X2 [Leptopilina heterotoma]